MHQCGEPVDQRRELNLQGYSARCPLTGAGVCFPDQEHLAADAVTAGNDQLYTVWRNFTPSGAVATCGGIGSGFVTTSISCSQDNGLNWTAAAAIPGAGDFPRVAVARDGTVYVTTLSGNNVLLNRFSSCATGLTSATGFPVTVATISGSVTCPMPGLDRCNDGNTLSSPTVAPDPGNADRLFVTFAENDGTGGERIVTRESPNRGVNFGPPTTVSGSTSARRFMPWSCSTRGRSWVGWYDRRAAKATGATNDLTEYFIGANRGPTFNLSNRRIRSAPRLGHARRAARWNSQDSCTAQPQLAGVRQRVGGGGSGNRCDFDAGGCPAGETCQTGGGCPKYGDYNGIACAENFVTAAWTSATAPAGLPAATGLGIFSSTVFVGTNWSRGDLTGVTGATQAAGDPAGYMFVVGGQATQHVVYRGVDGHIYELWWDAQSGWSRGDLTAITGATQAAGDPAGYMFVVGDQATQHVVYRGIDGHIYELWWDAQSGWSRGDLTAITGATQAAGDPAGYMFVVGGQATQHVVYRGVDGHIYELWWDAQSGWSRGDLTGVTGATGLRAIRRGTCSWSAARPLSMWSIVVLMVTFMNCGGMRRAGGRAAT